MAEHENRQSRSDAQQENFRNLFHQYSGYVYAIIWYRIRGIGTREDAEEAVSDVFAKVFRSCGQIEADKLQAYLRTAANHAATDILRRLRRTPEFVSDEETDWQEPAAPEHIAEDYEEAEQRKLILDCINALGKPDSDIVDYEEAEQRKLILDCINALGKPDSDIVLMRYYYKNSFAEIGKALHMQPFTARKRLSRAKKRLKQLLADAGITV